MGWFDALIATGKHLLGVNAGTTGVPSGACFSATHESGKFFSNAPTNFEKNEKSADEVKTDSTQTNNQIKQ